MSERVVVQCIGHAKNGQQCKRRTGRTSYCYQHLEKELHVRIKKSNLPGAGLGLFAAKTFKKGEKVAGYTGKIHTFQNPPPDNIGGDYWLQLTYRPPYKYVDAAATNTAPGRYANACKRGQCVNNAQLKPSSLPNQGAVKASRPIPSGREIHCSYGRTYWNGR